MNYRNAKVLTNDIYTVMLECAAGELKAHIKDVNDLNVFPVPDGDTGDNMWRTMHGGLKALAACKTEGLRDAVNTSSKGMLHAARGNSGVILSQFFKGITDVISTSENADAECLLIALQNGVRHAYAAVLNPTEGTILTVARESVEYAADTVDSGATLYELFTQLLTGMKESLEHTPELLPLLKQAGVIDSGGAGLYFIAHGFVYALSDEIDVLRAKYGYKAGSVDGDDEAADRSDSVNVNLFTADDTMDYGYCTELLVRLQNSKTDISAFDDDAIKQFLSYNGDSVVYIRDGSLLKLHVHTFYPEKVLEYMHQFGEFLKLKIENMTLEHSGTDSPRVPHATESDTSFGHVKKDRKYFAVVAVCAGDGFAETFRSMGADVLVSGGQSMNPSAQDFIDAFKQIDADNIIVFPNNKNIILSARQAAGLYTDSRVFVIESASLGQGFVGLANMYPCEDGIEEMVAAINRSIAGSCSGSVSVAAKSGSFDGISVSEGNYIGFVGKTIISASETLNDAALTLAGHLLSEDKCVLTVFCGREATDKSNSELRSALNEKYPGVEVYLTPGGQDVYSYIFVAD
ncbi:MAG: DAK2 domain-containing protein [Clostridia bacterium]|nr:DAK2 domain-containing protein [Clostridia bacterium]